MPEDCVEVPDFAAGNVPDPDSHRLAEISYRERKETDVRAQLAQMLAAVYALTILAYLAIAIWGNLSDPTWINRKDLLQILLTVETGLLGSVAGFYFATKR